MAKGNSDTGEKYSLPNRRKFLKAAGVSTVAGLAGCTGNDSNGSGDQSSPDDKQTAADQGTTVGDVQNSKVTLRFWNGSMTDEPANKKYWTSAVKKFNQQSNDVKVDLRGVPYEGMFKKIRAGAQSGPDQMPHMAEIASRIDVLLAADNLILEDDGLWEQSKLSSKVSDSIESVGRSFGQQSTGEKSLPAWPIGARPFLSTYRTDLLKQGGISASEVNTQAGTLQWRSDMGPIFEQLKGAKFNQKPDSAPSATGMKEGDEEFLSHYMGQMGVSDMSVVNSAGTHAVIDTKKAREVIKWQKDFIDKGYFHKNSINFGDEEITPRHWSGKIADNHLQDTADLWSSYRKELGDEEYLKNYDWGLPPTFKGGRKSTYAMIPIFATYKKAFQSQAEKDAMVEFVDFMAANNQEAVRRTKNLGWLPANPDVFEKNSYFTKSKLHKKYWGSVQTLLSEYELSTLPAIPGASQINFAIPRKMHQRILQQGMSVEKATARAAKEINQILKENDRYKPR